MTDAQLITSYYCANCNINLIYPFVCRGWKNRETETFLCGRCNELLPLEWKINDR